MLSISNLQLGHLLMSTKSYLKFRTIRGIILTNRGWVCKALIQEAIVKRL